MHACARACMHVRVCFCECVCAGLAIIIIIDVCLQGFHQIYGHIRRIYTVLANPMWCMHMFTRVSASKTDHVMK